MTFPRRHRYTYNAIWLARFLGRNERLLREFERTVESSLMARTSTRPISRSEPLTYDAHEVDADHLRQLKRSRRPVVVRGFLRRSTPVRDWTLDHLRQRCGNAVVGTLSQRIDRTNADAEHYASHEVEDVRLADVIDGVRAGGTRYATATSNIFHEHPELLDELGFERLQERLGVRVIRPELFLGGRQHGSYYHCALGGNVFCLLHGKKRWTFVDPAHSAAMYPNIGFSRSGLYFGSPIRTEVYDAQESIYPLYREVPTYEVELEAGDLLLNPSWWWHEVTNYGETIAIALRFPSAGSLNPLFSLLTIINPLVWRAAWRLRNGRLDLDDSYRKISLLRSPRA